MSSHLNDWTGKLHDYLLCCCWRSLPNRKRVVISCFHSPPIWLSLWWGQPATTSVLVLDLALMQTFLFFCFCFASSFGSYCVPGLLNQSHVHWLFPDTDGILECLLCDWAAISPQSHKQCFFSLPPRVFSGLVDALYAREDTEILFQQNNKTFTGEKPQNVCSPKNRIILHKCP